MNGLSAASPVRLALVLESNTDIRLVQELDARYELTVLARYEQIAEFAPPAGAHLEVGPSRRASYFAWVLRRLASGESRFDVVIRAELRSRRAGREPGRRALSGSHLDLRMQPDGGLLSVPPPDPGSTFRRGQK